MAGTGATERLNVADSADRPGPLVRGLGRPELVGEVRRVLQVVPRRASVVVAVSGGPDSAALAFLAHEARPELAVTLAHVRHHLRDDRADLDAVNRQASFLGSDLRVVDVTVASGGKGLEAAAREQRYAALRQLQATLDARWLLVGHTADDQAETVLLRLARGSGLRGLGGMAAVAGDLVRPLLRIRRDDVRAFVAGEGLPTVVDPSNDDARIRRVVVRTQVLPALGDVAADPVGALARAADLARVDADHLDALAGEMVRRAARRYGPCLALRRDALVGQGPAVATRVVRQLAMRVGSTALPPPAALVHDVLDLATGAVVDLPGVRFSRNGGWLAAAPTRLPQAPSTALAVPGRAPWTPVRLDVVADFAPGDERGQLTLDLPLARLRTPGEASEDAVPPGGRGALGDVALLLPQPETERLRVRARRAGDRIRTRVGHRKLADLMIDAGVPRVVRDLVPVVAVASSETGGEDRVVWVPGLAVEASDTPEGEPSRAAVRLRVAMASR